LLKIGGDGGGLHANVQHKRQRRLNQTTRKKNYFGAEIDCLFVFNQKEKKKKLHLGMLFEKK